MPAVELHAGRRKHLDRPYPGGESSVGAGSATAWGFSVVGDWRIVRGPRWRAWVAGRPARVARRCRVRRMSAGNSRLSVVVAKSG
jgi:hypothetical protein